jgi:hypothetical protein
MAHAAVPRRAAAVAGIAVALTAGASGGLVAADLEHHRTVTPTAVTSVEPGLTAQPSPRPPAPLSLTPAPAPQNSAPGQQPHTTTRAS